MNKVIIVRVTGGIEDAVKSIVKTYNEADYVLTNMISFVSSHEVPNSAYLALTFTKHKS